MADFKLESKLGDTRTARVTATWPEDVPEQDILADSPFDLTSVSEIWFTATYKDTDDTTPVFQKKLTTGGVTVDGNKAYIRVAAGDMQLLVDANEKITLDCEMQVRAADGQIWTVAEGTWKFTRQITRST